MELYKQLFGPETTIPDDPAEDNLEDEIKKAEEMTLKMLLEHFSPHEQKERPVYFPQPTNPAENRDFDGVPFPPPHEPVKTNCYAPKSERQYNINFGLVNLMTGLVVMGLLWLGLMYMFDYVIK